MVDSPGAAFQCEFGVDNLVVLKDPGGSVVFGLFFDLAEPLQSVKEYTVQELARRGLRVVVGV
jgi:hypothetical protein